MVNWDLGYRHIVDVDGQLLAIDADLIDVATLLKRADISPERQVWLVRAGERIPLEQRQSIRLSQDEVLFFETAEVWQAWRPSQLAA